MISHRFRQGTEQSGKRNVHFLLLVLWCCLPGFNEYGIGTTRNGGGAILRFSAGITSGIEYCSASSSLIFLILLLETDFMKGHSAFWAVAHEDGFQRGHLHVLIYLVHLDTASPRIEIAGDVPLVPVDRKAVEELVELVP